MKSERLGRQSSVGDVGRQNAGRSVRTVAVRGLPAAVQFVVADLAAEPAPDLAQGLTTQTTTRRGEPGYMS